MPTTVRVATYNLYLGADVTVVFGVSSQVELERAARVVLDQLVATDFAARAKAIAALMVRERVDLVGLQEVARWSREMAMPGGGAGTEVWLDFLSVLLDALTEAGQPYDVHASTPNFTGGAHIEGQFAMEVLGHNVVLVRRGGPVTVLSSRTGDFDARLDIVTGMPDPVLSIARSWGWVDAEVNGRRFRFVNSHLEAWDENVRNRQRNELLAAIGDPDRPVVVVGDFNATPDRVGMPREYVDAWAVAGRGGTGSTAGQRADLTGESTLDARIDYVWVRGAHVEGCRVVGDRPEDRTASGLWPSDHAAVIADITI